MASIFLIAIASGAMGAITAVATADDETKNELRKQLTPKQKKIMDMCESCANHIDRHDLRVDETLMGSPAMRVCEKITALNGPKLQQLIKRFLQSSKIDMEKLKKLSEMCDNDNSDLCKAVQDVSSSANEELLSEDQIRECAEEISQAYQNLKFKMPKDDWKDASDFEWKSDEEVASNVSYYQDLV